MVRAAMNGDLDKIPMRREPQFGLSIPESCPGVPQKLLDPRQTWQDKEEYDKQAQSLKQRFEKNYAQYKG